MKIRSVQILVIGMVPVYASCLVPYTILKRRECIVCAEGGALTVATKASHNSIFSYIQNLEDLVEGNTFLHVN